MLDTEVVNRFNFYSDHRLLRSVLRVGRHRYSPRSPKSKKIIISAELQELFQLKLEGSLEELFSSNLDIQEYYNKMEEALKKT